MVSGEKRKGGRSIIIFGSFHVGPVTMFTFLEQKARYKIEITYS